MQQTQQFLTNSTIIYPEFKFPLMILGLHLKDTIDSHGFGLHQIITIWDGKILLEK
ncbi:MAG: hypothetical protein HY430_02975 [Candidatus Levybacteria bacterium]|nr:hypothetical protein [Candidatus Levybacteria bacterium]